MPDYSIIEDCILTPGTPECFRIQWGEEIYGTWTPCQCCKWWDDLCTRLEEDYAEWDDDRDWPDKDWPESDDLEVIYTEDSFYNEFVKMLGLDG